LERREFNWRGTDLETDAAEIAEGAEDGGHVGGRED
jgi:hypothetical protein